MFFSFVFVQVHCNVQYPITFLFLGLPECTGHAGFSTGKASALRLVFVTAAFFLCCRKRGKSATCELLLQEAWGYLWCLARSTYCRISRDQPFSWEHRDTDRSSRESTFPDQDQRQAAHVQALCWDRSGAPPCFAGTSSNVCIHHSDTSDTQRAPGPQPIIKWGSSYTRSI